MADSAAIENAEAAAPERGARRRATVGHHIEFALARALMTLSRLAGVDRASAAGGAIARTVGPLLPETKVADDNLRAVFPDWTAEQRRQVIRGVWDNLGRVAAEFAHFDSFDLSGPDCRVEVVGAERFLRIADKPAVFVSGHFANWEIMSVLLQYVGVRFAVVYRAANNPLVDDLIVSTRGSASQLMVPKGNAGGRSLIDLMKKGYSLAMLVDQKMNSGVTAPFLGRDAKTATAAARLALRFSAPIVPASVERTGGARFRVHVHEPIQPAPTGDHGADILELTRRINDAIGEAVRARPEQWLWLHRRWPKES